MKVSILTSGFRDGFTVDFIKCIKNYYTNNGIFVFIASDFIGYLKTDRYVDTFLDMFKSSGIEFNEVHVIDYRTTQKDSIEYIKRADIIWLSGGDTLKQISYIKEYDLISYLQSREGITIGMSAGSINMPKTVVLAKDVNDNIPQLSIYDGIGLVDINIEPHLDSASEEHIKDIHDASDFATIYGLYDNSFITVIDNETNIYGTYYKFDKTNK